MRKIILGSFLFLAVPMIILARPAKAEYDASHSRILTLEKAHRMALENNYNMKSIKETIHQADIWIYKAWAILLPNISANASLTRNDKESKFAYPDMKAIITNAVSDAVANAMNTTPPPHVASGAGSENILQEKWGYSYGFTANMTLLNARSIPLILNATDNVNSTRYSGRHQRNDLLFVVTASYYTVNTSKEALELAREDLENANAFLKMAKARKAVGQAVKIEVLRAEIECMEAEKQLKNARDALKLAKTSLSYLIGYKGDFDVTDPEKPKPAKGSLKDLTERALQDRLDLKAARIQRTMAERDRNETLTKWVPVFDLTYNWNWDSATGFSGEHDSWRLIFGANWSLFEGGYKIAEAFERGSIMRQAEFGVSQLAVYIKEQVESSMIEYQKSLRNIELAEKQIALAEENYRLVKKQYEQGLATSLDLLDAQTTLSASRRNGALENLSLDLAVLTLNKALGEYNPLLNTVID